VNDSRDECGNYFTRYMWRPVSSGPKLSLGLLRRAAPKFTQWRTKIPSELAARNQMTIVRKIPKFQHSLHSDKKAAENTLELLALLYLQRYLQE